MHELVHYLTAGQVFDNTLPSRSVLGTDTLFQPDALSFVQVEVLTVPYFAQHLVHSLRSRST